MTCFLSTESLPPPLPCGLTPRWAPRSKKEQKAGVVRPAGRKGGRAGGRGLRCGGRGSRLGQRGRGSLEHLL